MKKRVISLFVTSMLATSLLIGCGNTAATGSTNTTTSENNGAATETKKQETAATETPSEPVEVTFWNSSSGEWDYWESIVKEFNETVGVENNIVLKMELPPEGVDLEIAAQNESVADIVFHSMNLEKFVDNDYIVALNDLPGMEDFLAENPTYIESETGFDGKTYKIANAMRVYGLAYNKDMFVAAGLVDENGEATPPKTWDEVREYAKILTDESKRQFGIVFPMKWSSWFTSEILPTAQSFSGYGYFDYQNGNYDYSALETPLNAIMGMKEDGSIYPGAEGLDNDPARARFAEGSIGMKLCVSWDVAVWNDQFPAQFEWGVAPMPTADGTYEYYQYARPNYSAAVFKNGNNIEEKGEAIATVYKYIYSTEAQVKGYEDAYYFPYRGDVVEKAANVNEDRTGWSDFGECVKVSAYNGPVYKTQLDPGFTGYQQSFLEKVWSGDMAVAEWIEYLTKTYNDGAHDYAKNNPDVDQSYIILPDIDYKIK